MSEDPADPPTEQRAAWRRGAGIRLGLFTGFAALLFLLCPHYLGEPPAELGTFKYRTFRETIAAINAGYPFHFYPGDPSEPFDASKLQRHYQVWGDHGFPYLVSCYAVLAGPFLGEAPVSMRTFQLAVPALLCVCSALLLLAPVPWPRLLGGQLALLFVARGVYGGGLTVFEPRSLTALTVLLVAWFYVVSCSRERSRRDWVYLTALALLVGLTQFLRQSAVFIALATPLTLGALSLALLAVRKLRGGTDLRAERRRLARACLPSVLLVGAVFANQVGALFTYAAAYERAPTYSIYPSHGAGLPLYISLGYVENAYNVTWDDETAYVHHSALYLERFAFDDKATQHRLRRAWRAIVLEDPALFLRNLLTKAAVLIGNVMRTSVPPDAARDTFAVSPNWTHPLLGLAGLFVLGLLLQRLLREPGLERLTFTAMVLGLGAGAAASSVIVFPGAYASVIGMLIALTFVFAPAALDPRQAEEGFLDLLRWLGALALALVLLGLGYVAVRALINRAEARALLEHDDPVAAFQSDGWRTTVAFNRLAPAERAQVAERILSSEAPLWRGTPLAPGPFEALAMIPPGAGPPPLAGVLVRLGAWKPPNPGTIQGPRSATLVVERDPPSDPTVVHVYGWSERFYQRITDAHWDGSHRLFCFPAHLPARIPFYASARTVERPGPGGFVYSFIGASELR